MVRAIKGQSQIQRFRCNILGWHRWTTYTVVEVNQDYFRMPLAKCECADCGMPRFEHPYSKTYKKTAQ